MMGLASLTMNPRVSVIARKRGADVLRPLSDEHPDDELFDGLLILRPEEHIYFVNAQNVGDQVRALVAKYQPKVVALDFNRVPGVEYSALQLLMDGDKQVAGSGVAWLLVGLNPGVLEAVRKAGLADQLGAERLLFNARAAIEKFQAMQATS